MPLINPATGTNPDQYSALLTTTLQNFRPQLVDNFSDSTPFLWWMTQNERKRLVRGGTNIEIPLMYAGAPVQAFSGFDKLDTEPVEGIAPATFLWKMYQVPIVISKDHETNNMDESQVVSLLEAKVQQAEISFREELNYDLINNGNMGTTDGPTIGTADSTVVDSQRVVGLRDICQDSGQARPYAGISGSTYSWWANKMGEVAAGTGGFDTTGIADMRSVYMDCARGNDKPDLILSSQEAYELYDGLLVDQKRFVNTMAADAGFESLMYRATTILYDRDVDADSMFFLNSNYLTLFVHPDVDMVSTPFREAENQWARFSRIMWKGCLACSNRARQGVLLNANS